MTIKRAKKALNKLNSRVKEEVEEEVLRIKRFRRKIFVSLLGTVGVVLLWRGLWMLFDLTPFVEHPIISVFVGIFVLIVSGFLYKL